MYHIMYSNCTVKEFFMNRKIIYILPGICKTDRVNKRTLHYYNEIGLFRPLKLSERTDTTTIHAFNLQS